MTAPVLHLYGVVEGSPDPLTIPRPPADAVRFDELPNRLWTYAVRTASPDNLLLGYVRWSDNDQWIARDRGSANAAARVKRFADKSKAVRWLQSRLSGGQC